MYIKSVQVSNYKSFVASGIIEFEPGINLIVGENNAGKTALLEVLGQTWNNNPTVGPNASGSDVSSARLTFRLTRDDLRPIHEERNGTVYMPAFQAERVSDWLMQNWITNGIDVVLQIDAKNSSKTIIYPYKATELGTASNAAVQFDLPPIQDDVLIQAGKERGGIRDDIEPLIRAFDGRIFFFDCRRIEVHTAETLATTGPLLSTALNLSAKIQEEYNEDNPRFHSEYMPLVKRVLPQIKSISPSIDGTKSTLKISPHDSASGRTSYLLSQSGTGVGQVLAMLFVIVYEKPSAIVIDEPNSFLHPAATRELLRVFKENFQHQYFMSTHSPEVFSEVKPQRYTALKYSNGQTTAENLSLGDLSRTMTELGISPFYSHTLWVEGESEVQSFPIIHQDLHTQYFPLLYADEIPNNGAKETELDRIIKTYDKIGRSLNGEELPTTMYVVIDGEHITPARKADFDRRPDKLVKWLPRKMFENYLLDSDAIAAVIGAELKFNIAVADIERELATSRGNTDVNEWLASVHGADLLGEMFGSRLVPFKKTKHSVELTKWILKHKPENFLELKSFLDSVCNGRIPDAEEQSDVAPPGP